MLFCVVTYFRVELLICVLTLLSDALLFVVETAFGEVLLFYSCDIIWWRIAILWFWHNLMTKCCFRLWYHLVTYCYYWLWHHLLLLVGNVVGLNTTICPLLLQDLVEYLHVLNSTDTKKILCDNRYGFCCWRRKIIASAKTMNVRG